MKLGVGGAKDYDAVIVGAGVIGSAAAFALARQGARCLLLEAAPDAIRRYAGEWMHPTVRVLMDQLGLAVPEAARSNDAGAGFVVHPEDGSEPIVLPSRVSAPYQIPAARAMGTSARCGGRLTKPANGATKARKPGRSRVMKMPATPKRTYSRSMAANPEGVMILRPVRDSRKRRPSRRAV